MRLHSDTFSSGQVADLLGVSYPTVDYWLGNGDLPALVLPDSSHRRVARKGLIRFLLKKRMLQLLANPVLGWSPRVLVLGTGTRLASDLRECLAEEKVGVSYAGEMLEGGMLCERLDPLAVIFDFSLGRERVRRALLWLVHHRPWTKLVGLLYEDEMSLGDHAERMCDAILEHPFTAEDLAEALRPGE